MTESFANALKAGLIEAAMLWDGTPFIVDGVQYYRATQNGINKTVGRFHAMASTLQRHDALKVSEGVQNAYLDQMEMLSRRIEAQATLDAQQVLDAASEIKILTDRMRTRMQVGLSIEQFYEIASMWYFSDEEELTGVDHTINRRKIKSWLTWERSDLLYAYLLSQPIGNYMPINDLSKVSVLDYIQQANTLELLDLTRIMARLAIVDDPRIQAIIDTRREVLRNTDALLVKLLDKSGPKESTAQ